MLSPHEIWEQSLAELELQMSKPAFNTWLKGTSLISRASGCFSVGVRNGYAKDWLDNRLKESVERILTAVSGEKVTVTFVVQPPELLPVAGPPELKSAFQSKKGKDGKRSSNNGRKSDVCLNIIHFDPRDKLGWVKCGHYQNFYWRMYLNARAKAMGAKGASPYSLWLMLQSWQQIKKTSEIDIQELADVYAGGNRHRMLGRDKRGKRQVGDLEILEYENIAWHTTKGVPGTRQIKYVINVLGDLPLLTPTQVELLPPEAQHLHDAILATNQLDLSQWRQLDFLSLVNEIHP